MQSQIVASPKDNAALRARAPCRFCCRTTCARCRRVVRNTHAHDTHTHTTHGRDRRARAWHSRPPGLGAIWPPASASECGGGARRDDARSGDAARPRGSLVVAIISIAGQCVARGVCVRDGTCVAVGSLPTCDFATSVTMRGDLYYSNPNSSVTLASATRGIRARPANAFKSLDRRACAKHFP